MAGHGCWNGHIFFLSMRAAGRLTIKSLQQPALNQQHLNENDGANRRKPQPFRESGVCARDGAGLRRGCSASRARASGRLRHIASCVFRLCDGACGNECGSRAGRSRHAGGSAGDAGFGNLKHLPSRRYLLYSSSTGILIQLIASLFAERATHAGRPESRFHLEESCIY